MIGNRSRSLSSSSSLFLYLFALCRLSCHCVVIHVAHSFPVYRQVCASTTYRSQLPVLVTDRLLQYTLKPYIVAGLNQLLLCSVKEEQKMLGFLGCFFFFCQVSGVSVWWQCQSDETSTTFHQTEIQCLSNYLMASHEIFCTDIHGSQMMNLNGFGNSLTFPQALLWGSHLWDSWKCLDSYWSVFHEIWYKYSCFLQDELQPLWWSHNL